MQDQVSGFMVLQDIEDLSVRNGFFTIVGPYGRMATIVWDAIHSGTGGANSTAWTRLYFSTPSTGGRILLYSKEDRRFNNYDLTSSKSLTEAQRTLHLPSMVEGTFLMEYGNDGGADVTSAKLDIKVAF